MSIFQIRLKNCIQAIIEQEAGIRARSGGFFDKDLLSLKSYLALIDKMELGEEDVRRMEDITSDFLAEVGDLSPWRAKNMRFLQ